MDLSGNELEAFAVEQQELNVKSDKHIVEGEI